jgi:hypothetical protein
MFGIDYAFYPHPPITAMKTAGVRFAGRYVSADPANDTNGKNLLPGECKALLAAGIDIIMVAESYAARMREGRASGVADATHADAVVKALGMPGIPVYFACDFDATPADQTPINAYLDGAASVIGHARTGIYGGFWPLSRALDGGHAVWAWQTIAWSGGQWDPRAHIRQGLKVTVGGVEVDMDDGRQADFGQWPRPAVPPPGHDWYWHAAGGYFTLNQIRHGHAAGDVTIGGKVYYWHAHPASGTPYLTLAGKRAVPPSGPATWA